MDILAVYANAYGHIVFRYRASDRMETERICGLLLRNENGSEYVPCVAQPDERLITLPAKNFFTVARDGMALAFVAGTQDFFQEVPTAAHNARPLTVVTKSTPEYRLEDSGAGLTIRHMEADGRGVANVRVVQTRIHLALIVKSPLRENAVLVRHRRSGRELRFSPHRLRRKAHIWFHVFLIPYRDLAGQEAGIWDIYRIRRGRALRLRFPEQAPPHLRHTLFNHKGIPFAAKAYRTKDGDISLLCRPHNACQWEKATLDGCLFRAELDHVDIAPRPNRMLSFEARLDDGRCVRPEVKLTERSMGGSFVSSRYSLTLDLRRCVPLFHRTRIVFAALYHDGSSNGSLAPRFAEPTLARHGQYGVSSCFTADRKKSLGRISVDARGELSITFTTVGSIELESVHPSAHGVEFACRCHELSPEPGARLRLNFENGSFQECAATQHGEASLVFACGQSLAELAERPFYLTMMFSEAGVRVCYMVVSPPPCRFTLPGFFLLSLHKEYELLVFRRSVDLWREKLITVLRRAEFTAARGLAWTLKKICHRPVWLIGEYLSQTASDNGFAFFRFLSEAPRKERYWYVATPRCAADFDLNGYHRRVVLKDSFKHMFLYCMAKKCLVSHGLSDVMPTHLYRFHSQNWKDVYYLQHGVIAMKKVGYTSHTYNNKLKKFVVSSPKEATFLTKQLGKTLICTGLSRHDYLCNNPYSQKTLLVAPTWPDWLPEIPFTESALYKAYYSFFTDKKFQDFVCKHNIMVHFILHKYIHTYRYLFEDIKNIKVISHHYLQESISRSHIMITDYSSIAFDFACLEKPVIFYWYDHIHYKHVRGMYIQEEDLFGYKTSTIPEVIRALHDIMHFECNIRSEDKEKLKAMVSYSDRQCCSRLYNALKGKP